MSVSLPSVNPSAALNYQRAADAAAVDAAPAAVASQTPEQSPQQTPQAHPGAAASGVQEKANTQAANPAPQPVAGMEDELNNTLQSLQDAPAPASWLGDVVEKLADTALAVQTVFSTPELAALPASDRQLAVQTVIDSGGDPAVIRDLQTQVRDPSFQAMTPDQRTAALTETALLQTPEYKALPASDQQLVREALANRKPGDTGLPASIKSLLESEQFQNPDDFGAQERTALLSQVRNYPDTRSVENMEKLLGKQWFRDFDLGDTQRALKTVAFLSQHDAGDQTIISNTLDLFLAENAPYHFDFSETRAFGSVPAVPGDLFKINPAYIGADNNPVDTSARSAERGELRVIGHTFVHEVNHMRNWDKSLSLNSSYGFHEEYRAYYVGVQAQSGDPPAVADVIDRVAGFVNVDGSYDHLAALLDAKGQDAQEIVAYLNTILGRNDLTVDNARAEVNALVQAKRDAETNGTPLPDALTRPAGVTIGPDGTNNRTNE